MSEKRANPHPTLALNTKLEEDFVSPLTAIRGSLEILRDYPDLGDDERRRFVESALRGCAQMEKGVEHLATTVYAAGQKAQPAVPAGLSPETYNAYRARVRFIDEIKVAEIDFSGFEFSNSKIVNDFYDAIDQVVEATGHDWYCLVNYGNCSIWPEAWVAFAHRGQKFNTAFSLGTVRYAEREGDEDARSSGFDPNLFATRDLALAQIEAMKTAKPA